MTLQQFRRLTAHLPPSTLLVWHDCHAQTIEPAEAFQFADLTPGDPLRLRLSPGQILISGTGDPVPTP